jgi:hypothetical protein
MVFPVVVLVFDFEEFSEEVLHGHCIGKSPPLCKGLITFKNGRHIKELLRKITLVFQGCMFVNNSDRTLSWTLHTQEAGPLLEDGTFKFLHRTGSPFTPSSAKRRSTIPSITLESGETFQLGVLFSPRKYSIVQHFPEALGAWGVSRLIQNGRKMWPKHGLEMSIVLTSYGLYLDFVDFIGVKMARKRKGGVRWD